MDKGKLIAVAAELFHLHGLDVRGWRLEFRNFAHRLGCCSSQHKIIAINAYYNVNEHGSHTSESFAESIPAVDGQ
jgi:hypothetical protein